MSRIALTIGLLAAVYLLALESTKPLDVVQAVALAGLLVATLGRGSVAMPRGATHPPGPATRVVFAPVLAAVMLREVLLGTWQVALVALGVRRLRRPGIVALPIGDRSDLGVAVTGHLLTLSPGEALVDVERERGRILIHAIDASDPEGVRRRHERLYRRYQRKVVP